MEVTIIGIIGNTLFIEPFYGGDNVHESTIDKVEKKELIKLGIKEFPNRDHIEAYLHGMTYEEYLVQYEIWQEEALKPEVKLPVNPNGLPF